MDTIVFGDLHIREERPFVDAFSSFLDWVEKQDWNRPENTGVFLGDIFHRYFATSIENDLAIRAFKDSFKFKKKIILRGNHDFKTSKNALQIFNSFKDVECVYSPKSITVEDKECLFLPSYTYDVANRELVDMKKFYEDKSNPLFKKEYAYIFGHFSDVSMFGEGIDIKHIKGTKVFGHLHVHSVAPHYLGVPVISRYDEKGTDCRIAKIECDGKLFYLPVPKFIDYYSVEYGKPLDATITAKYPILDIVDAPDKESALSLYGSNIIREIILKDKTVVSNTDGDNAYKDAEKSYEDFMAEFIQDNKIEEGVKTILLNKLGGSNAISVQV